MSGGAARIDRRFADLRAAGRAGLVAYVMAGDPDLETSARIFAGLPAAGADVIELGMAFTDPMADGPSVQAAGLRALKAGISLRKTLDMVRAFRANDDDTPVVLMVAFIVYFYTQDLERSISLILICCPIEVLIAGPTAMVAALSAAARACGTPARPGSTA